MIGFNFYKFNFDINFFFIFLFFYRKKKKEKIIVEDDFCHQNDRTLYQKIPNAENSNPVLTWLLVGCPI
jgi:hypothetical protein